MHREQVKFVEQMNYLTKQQKAVSEQVLVAEQINYLPLEQAITHEGAIEKVTIFGAL